MQHQEQDHERLTCETIDPGLFDALLNMDIDKLQGHDLRQVLPYLTNLILNPSFVRRQELIRVLHPIRKMNDMLEYLSIRCIEPNSFQQISFESCGCSDRLKLVAAEYVRIQDAARLSNQTQQETKLIRSELFDNPIYIEDISYCLCALIMRSTNINIIDLSEALLHTKFCTTYIVRLAANMPDRCQELCQSLISLGEKLDEGAINNEVSTQRSKTLRLLCLMNPSIAPTLRAATWQLCKMPSLTVMITSDNLSKALTHYKEIKEKEDNSEILEVFGHLEDTFDSAVAFITGIFLGSDDNTRTWFAQYTKSAQLKRIDPGLYSVLTTFRSLILAYINVLFPNLQDESDFDSLQEADSDNKSKRKDAAKPQPRGLNKKLIRATATLRLYCALRGIGSLKLNSEETEILMRLITCKSGTVNPSVINFATTGVCTLLACSGLIGNQKEEKRAADWLKWLIKDSEYGNGSLSGHAKCSLSEILLLVAIHFLNNQTSQISDLVCTTLGMKLQIKASVTKCKTLFVQEVFNDQVVTEHAVSVPVTVNLNNHISEFLPIHCVHQLLENRSFSKHQISIHDWILRQICQSTRPIHYMLPKLVEAYVNSVIISTNAHGHCGTNQCIPEADIARVFKIKLYSNVKRDQSKEDDSMDTTDCDELPIADPSVSQIMLLYYLLLYDELRLRKFPELSNAERVKLVKYSQDFMLEIPIFYLIQIARDDQDSFGVVLPDIIRLVTLQYPQLCSIQHWLNLDPIDYESKDPNLTPDEQAINDSLMILPKVPARRQRSLDVFKANLYKQITDDFDRTSADIQLWIRVLNQILLLNRDEIWLFVQPFINSLSKVVALDADDNNTYHQDLIQIVTKLWWKFNNIFPRKLWVLTVNALRKVQKYRSTTELEPVEYSCDEIVIDPLIVLRCDERVFRCVNLLNIVLHILSAFLASSRRTLHDQIIEQAKQKDNRGVEELRVTLMHAQTSAAIQILLESCIPDHDEQACLIKQENGLKLSPIEKLRLNRLDSCINCICEHLHQVFIADINLAKLVHFQTYPSELLSVTSDRIPSMHICLDFIPELICQPDLDKQIFVIELTSHLCTKYATTKSLNVAKMCFNVSFTMLQFLPSERRALFYIPVLPALLRICKVFPILKDDASVILNQIKQVTQSHLASTSSRLSSGTCQPFEGLDELTWRQAKSLMGSLSPNEALYVCIHRCMFELDKLKKNSKQDLFIQKSTCPVYNPIFAYGNHVINPGT